jgi:hypothetical protein
MPLGAWQIGEASRLVGRVRVPRVVDNQLSEGIGQLMGAAPVEVPAGALNQCRCYASVSIEPTRRASYAAMAASFCRM